MIVIYYENFYEKKKEKTTTDINNQWSYLERYCAPECGEETVSFSDKETVTNICCKLTFINILLNFYFS